MIGRDLKLVILFTLTFPFLLFSETTITVTSIEKQPPFFAIITYEIHKPNAPLTTIRVKDDDGFATIAALEMMWNGKTDEKKKGKIPNWDSYRSILEPAIGKALLTLRSELKENEGDPKYKKSIQSSIDELTEIKTKLMAEPTYENAFPLMRWLNIQTDGLKGSDTKITRTYTFTRTINDKTEDSQEPLSKFAIGKSGSRYADGHPDFVDHDISKISDGFLDSLLKHKQENHKPKKK